jgi:general stress protein YciG
MSGASVRQEPTMDTQNNPQTNNTANEVLTPDAPPEPVGEARPRARRGFAVMAPELVKAISRKGGVAAHAAKTAHEFTSDEAREAGRKGGFASQIKRRQRREQEATAGK